MSTPLLSQYIARRYQQRKWINRIMCSLLGAATLLSLLPLFSILSTIFFHGLPALTLSFFTELPKPIGESGGGVANSIAGTLTLITLASSIGVPWGISVGVFLSEYTNRKLSKTVRFSADMLSSIPSIIIGLFVYTVVVMQMKRFSALAGGIALGILMVPIIARSVEELLRLVPIHIREAGLALGLPRWKVILQIVLKGQLRAISTTVILAIARIAGETAPLLFTAFNNRFWQRAIDQPIASLPIQIYNYAISPYEDWHEQAWAGAFVLVALIFTMNLATRVITRTAPDKR